MALRVDFETRGFKEMDQALKSFDPFYKRESVKTVEKGNDIVTAGWVSVAPVDTFLYRNTISSVVQTVSGILIGKSFTTARSPKGFDYPRALEDSPKYHYRRTRRRGQSTAGQVSRMFQRMLTPINALFANLQDRLVAHLDIN